MNRVLSYKYLTGTKQELLFAFLQDFMYVKTKNEQYTTKELNKKKFISNLQLVTSMLSCILDFSYKDINQDDQLYTIIFSKLYWKLMES